jgi:hypothetical protein
MSVPKFFNEMVQYVSGAMSRIFGLNDDQYPNTGVQPFEGEPNKKPRSGDW